MKVKLVWCDFTMNDDDFDSSMVVKDNLSDWEEITKEELKLLEDNLHHINKLVSYPRFCFPKIIVQDDIPIRSRIDSVKEYLRLVEIEKKRKAEEEELKKQEKEKQKQQMKEAQEKKLFAQLKEKYETQNF